MRILLIEDDGLIGDGIKNGLEKLGFTVDWFSDGNDGHEALLCKPNTMLSSLIWVCRAATDFRF